MLLQMMIYLKTLIQVTNGFALVQGSVKDVFLNKSLLGQKVTLEGNIVSQCQSNGCWFYLRDATGQIYIDLKTHNFTLPSMPNKNVNASGTVAQSQNTVLLVASGVEVK